VMMRRAAILLTTGLALVMLSPIHARADLSKNEARKVIRSMGGWSLPGDSVRVQSIKSSGTESAEASAELVLIFRVRLHKGQWQLREIRTGPDHWEQLESIARAAQVKLPEGECAAQSQFERAKYKYSTHLTTKSARCLVARLFGVALPSDDVRIKESSPVGLSLGPESAALVVALVRADFRFTRNPRGWQVAEFKSGTRDWVNVSGLPAALDQVKRATATDELETIAKALAEFRRARGSFVVADEESILIDHLSPRYLARVIRVDPWYRPYHYEGQSDHYSLRSVGPDGKLNTADDIVVSGP
jgi:hypothetical protein